MLLWCWRPSCWRLSTVLQMGSVQCVLLLPCYCCLLQPPLGQRRALFFSGMYGSEITEVISAYRCVSESVMETEAGPAGAMRLTEADARFAACMAGTLAFRPASLPAWCPTTRTARWQTSWMLCGGITPLCWRSSSSGSSRRVCRTAIEMLRQAVAICLTAARLLDSSHIDTFVACFPTSFLSVLRSLSSASATATVRK